MALEPNTAARLTAYTVATVIAAGPFASRISTTPAGRDTKNATWWIRPRKRGFGEAMTAPMDAPSYLGGLGYPASMASDLVRRIAVARGDEPADLVLCGGRVLSVFTGEFLEADVAIVGHHVAGVGPGYRGNERVDVSGLTLLPGFIDGPLH